MTKKAPPPTLTPQQRLTVVKHLANGRGLDFTAAATGLPADQVRDVGSKHGWPHEQSLAKAVQVLQRRLDQDDQLPPAQHTTEHDVSAARGQHTRRTTVVAGTATTPDRPLRPVDTPTPPAATPAPAPDPEPVTPPEPGTDYPTADLLERGHNSGSKRTRNLADKITADLTKLRDQLTEQARAEREQREKERERLAALDEVRQAEEALAEARAKLRKHKNHPGGNGRATTTRAPSAASRRAGGKAAGSTVSAARAAGGLVTTEQLTQRGLDSKALRAWAEQAGVDCSPTGRVPKRVLDAYDDAHPDHDRSATA